MAIRDQLHQTVNIHSREAFLDQHFPQEIPVDTVVGLLKIELQKHSPQACWIFVHEQSRAGSPPLHAGMYL
jgi:N-glycosylase/DNA lyase